MPFVVLSDPDTGFVVSDQVPPVVAPADKKVFKSIELPAPQKPPPLSDPAFPGELILITSGSSSEQPAEPAYIYNV